MIEEIIVQVKIIGKDFQHSFEEDYTEYAKDLIKYKNIFSNTGELITEKNIHLYFENKTFNENEIVEANGNHFIYGFLEGLGQSTRCPKELFTYKGELTYQTTRLFLKI